jgi:plastocyanin
MGGRRIAIAAAAALLAATVLAACGGGRSGDGGSESGGAGAGGPDERTVLVDYHHDQFAGAFLGYFPKQVKVHPGGAVRFKQAWTGEPHSVTLGKVVDDMLVLGERFEKYNSEEEALAGGESQEDIDAFLGSAAKVPGMVAYEGYEIYQPGARPCFIDDPADVPNWSDPEKEEIDPKAACPDPKRKQPAFDGTQGLYNSGFIPPDGDHANTFVVPIAAVAEPGTYRYFCDYHWTSMSGEIEVVPDSEPVPSQAAVSRTALKEVAADAKVALQKIGAARKAKTVDSSNGTLSLPLAGREADEQYQVLVNEFLPKKVEARVGKPVTWTFDGTSHTVSFNVPKYFPVFDVERGGDVRWNPQAHKPVGWDVPARPPGHDDDEQPPPPRKVDVGEWDGRGGFRSSGSLDPGESFTVTFTRAGTYPFACVLHPQMVGTVDVKA